MCCRASAVQSFDRDHPSWMGDLRPNLDSFAFTELHIPGTHNSATSTINTKSPYAPGAPDITKKFPKLARGVTARWAKCQSMGIGDQLRHGVRYFDLRIAPHGPARQFHVCHSLFAVPFQDVLVDVSEFLLVHPDEIIVLDVQHVLGDVTAVDHAALAASIPPLLAAALIRRPFHPGTPLRDLYAARQNVFLLYPDADTVEQHAFMHHRRTTIMSRWPNQQSADDLVAALASIFVAHAEERKPSAAETASGTAESSRHRPHLMFVTQAVLTPATSSIVGSVFSNKGLRSFAKEAAYPAVAFWRSHEMAKTHNHLKNVLMVDYVELTGVVDVCLRYNQDLAAMARLEGGAT